jgi:hypothetical protein
MHPFNPQPGVRLGKPHINDGKPSALLEPERLTLTIVRERIRTATVSAYFREQLIHRDRFDPARAIPRKRFARAVLAALHADTVLSAADIDRALMLFDMSGPGTWDFQTVARFADPA